MKVLPCGDRAIMLDCATLDEALRWYAAVHQRVDAVVGARTVLLHGDPTRLRDLVRSTEPGPSGTVQTGTVEIPVVYDGPDLDDVARAIGLSVDDIVLAHTGASWTAAFGGFAPGFAYLVGDEDRLHVPRRDSPRTSVPAGSVGLAGGFSGIYPRSSPGGWQLIGRTDTALWDVDRDPPALLVPGTTVRFVAR